MDRAPSESVSHTALRVQRGFEDAAIGMIILTRDLHVLQLNDALCRLLGRTAEEVLGHCILEFTHTEDLELSEHQRAAIIADENDPAMYKRYVRPNGSVVEAKLTSKWVEPDAGEPYFFSQLQDVTEERRAHRRTATIAELGRRALDDTDPLSLMDETVPVVRAMLEADVCVLSRRGSDGRLRVTAVAGAEVASSASWPYDGTQIAYTLEHDEPVVSHDLAAEDRFRAPADVLDAGMRRSLSVPVPQRSGAQHIIVGYRAAVRDPFGVADTRFLQAVANVFGGALDRAAAEDELRRRALEDSLTGLANRALLMTGLERELRHGARLGARVSVLLLDVDRFKTVNDTLGHAIGDALLRQVAARLKACVRDEDLVARLGGDEFVVVCSRTDTDQAIGALGARLVDAMRAPFAIEDAELEVGASVGIAVAETGAVSPEALLRDADAAMYRAKEAGGGCYEIFDAALRRRLADRLMVERDLRHAVERGELELHYQPLVELAAERLIGFEALIRWRHPERGLIAPGDFIGLAEQTGLIVPIGSWVLRTGCAQLARWPQHVSLSINLSAAQVTPALVPEVRELLALHQLDPQRIVLEITESLVLDPRTKPVIVALRELGVHIALDDFGTGYSSLGSLQRFPMDILKLDRSLITSLSDDTGAAVVRAAVELGRTLGLHVIAEGIEDREQAHQLHDLGCRLGQGFLFAHPLPAHEAHRLIASTGRSPRGPAQKTASGSLCRRA